MAFNNIFPYKNRFLGQAETLTQKAEQCSVNVLVRIFLSNLQPGDTLALAKYTLNVIAISETELVYSTASGAKHNIDAQQIADSALFRVLLSELPGWAPAYTNPLCLILERDPAVFRLRDHTGWVVNDALCLSSGNVQYSLNSAQTERADEESSDSAEPDDTPLVTTVSASGQIGFGF